MEKICTYSNSIENLKIQLKKDYHVCALSLVYKFKGNQRELIFCCIEMIPSWLEVPPEIDESEKVSDYTINFRKVIFQDPLDGLNWYLKIHSDEKVELPITVKDRKNGWDKSPRFIDFDEMGEEPMLPFFTLPDEDHNAWDGASIWGKYPGGFRWHQKRSLSPKTFIEIFESDKGIEKSFEWLSKQLPFDLSTRPLMMGSAHLILINPLFKAVGFRPSRIDPNKIILNLTFGHPYTEHTLKAYIRESRPSGNTQISDFVITSSLTEIECPYDYQSIGLEITCSLRGLIYYQKPSPYIKNISIGLGIISKQRIIKIPKVGKNKREEEFSSGIVGHVENIVVGDNTPLKEALPIVLTEKYQVKSIKTAKDLEQSWFSGNQNEATSFIKKIVVGAKDDVFFIDPYFGRIELSRYALAVTEEKINIRILTSKVFLKMKECIDGVDHENLELLYLHLQNVLAQDQSLKIEIRVMTGDSPNIHDRFIKSKKNIWMLGSSLNEFGKRGTMAIRLPYPDMIAIEVEKEWDKATPIEKLWKA